MYFLFVPFDKFDYKTDFLVQGSCVCKSPDLIGIIKSNKIDNLSICEMHNHSNAYRDVGECLSLLVKDDLIIKVEAMIRKPNTISKIQEGVLIGFSIKFDTERKLVNEIAVIDSPTLHDEEIGKFIEAITRRRLLYSWTLREKGFPINDLDIRKLEAEVYPDIQDSNEITNRPFRQRDIDELQLLLSLVEPQNIDDGTFTKAVVFRLQDITVRIWKENNHKRPHFHIKYRNQYSASYAIDTLECLAGEVPSKYEKVILKWAERNRESLRLTWKKLQAGENICELVSPADTV